MLLPELSYGRPTTIGEALELLSSSEDARPLAGGQTLVNVMKAGVAAPGLLVDLQDVEELRGIGIKSDGALDIGAMVSTSELARSSEVAATRPIIGEVAAQIADVQVRNRGTVGGNLCANDPTNHLPPLFVALGATMTIVGPAGTRTATAEEFFLGVYLTAVGPGELLTRLTIPASHDDGFASVTIGRHGTCIVNAAASLGDAGPRVVMGCVAATPVRLTRMEASLTGSDLSEETIRAAAAGIGAELDPPSDIHGSASYRRHLAETLAVRATLAAATRRRDT
jgi:carbon-monoxide dehydrogenase medium subunit